MNDKINFVTKIKFWINRPKTVIILGNQSKSIKEKTYLVLKNKFKINKEIFIFEANEKNIKKFIFFVNFSEFPVFVLTNPEQIFLIKELPFNKIFFILNYDEEKAKEINNFENLKTIKFGFKPKNDIFISDIKENGSTNFKINYKGSSVPFWLKKELNKKQINNLLAVMSIAIIFGFNLVEISQILKETDF